MPELSLEALQLAVDEGRIAAITLDTNVFDKSQSNLSSRTLLALEQFRDTGIAVLFSSVTLGEVRAHITRDSRAAAENLTSALNQYAKTWKLDLDRGAEGRRLGLENDPASRAQALVDAYVARIGAAVVPVEPGVSATELERRYFAAEPPFSGTGEKKAEFPDAMALLSLEAWGREREAMVLAISKDQDWRDFAAGSDHVTCITDLRAALNLFNKVDGVIAARIRELVREQRAPALYAAVESAIERFLSEFDVEATSQFFFEEEAEEAVLKAWKLADAGQVQVVASDEDSVTLAFDVAATVEFTAWFRFSHWDGGDREYVPMGSGRGWTEQEDRYPVLVTVAKEDGDDPVPIDVEVDGPPATVVFDEVEPDWNDG